MTIIFYSVKSYVAVQVEEVLFFAFKNANSSEPNVPSFEVI